MSVFLKLHIILILIAYTMTLCIQGNPGQDGTNGVDGERGQIVCILVEWFPLTTKIHLFLG